MIISDREFPISWELPYEREDARFAPLSAWSVEGLENGSPSLTIDAKTGSDIIVTGIERAAQIKRDAQHGRCHQRRIYRQIPDVNVAGSVQDIAGVQVNRTRGEGLSVNIDTPHAPDIDKFVLALAAQAKHESNSGKSSPQMTGLFADYLTDINIRSTATTCRLMGLD